MRHPAFYTGLFRLDADVISNGIIYQHFVPIRAFQHFIRLQYMRMRSYYYIYLILKKKRSPSYLKIINFFCIFRSPMCKYNNKIRFLSSLLYINPDLFFIFQKMHHIWITFRQGDAVCVIGVIEQGKLYIVSYYNFIRFIFRFFRCLNAKAKNSMFGKKIFGGMDSLRSLVKCMVCGTGDHMKPCIYDGIPHLNGSSEPWVVTVFGRIRYKGGFLIDNGDVIFPNRFYHMFI